MRVKAAGVNRPDVLQRQGGYPPPPGAPLTPGLEIAGEVTGLGQGVRRYEVGEAKAAADSEARDRRAGDVPSRRDEFRTYKFSGWELSTGTRRLLSPAGARVELTNGEFAMLVTFLKSPMRVLSRDQLLESSRLHDDIYDRSIDVQILRLRRKIETDSNEPKLVKTERGAGYIFNSEVTF